MNNGNTDVIGGSSDDDPVLLHGEVLAHHAEEDEQNEHKAIGCSYQRDEQEDRGRGHPEGERMKRKMRVGMK